MPKFLVYETIIREFEVDAENMDDAYEKTLNDASVEFSEHSEGLTYIRQMDGVQERFL